MARPSDDCLANRCRASRFRRGAETQFRFNLSQSPPAFDATPGSRRRCSAEDNTGDAPMLLIVVLCAIRLPSRGSPSEHASRRPSPGDIEKAILVHWQSKEQYWKRLYMVMESRTERH
jgi:hypothetical protein